MLAFIWQELEEVTGHTHDEAGVLIIAEDYARAWELLEDRSYYKNKARPRADYVYPISSEGELVLVFPNAGCC